MANLFLFRDLHRRVIGGGYAMRRFFYGECKGTYTAFSCRYNFSFGYTSLAWYNARENTGASKRKYMVFTEERHMKHFTIVLDGIADRPQQMLGGKTPMEAAGTPALNQLFSVSKPGTVRTIPPGLEIGSAVANMSLMGYDPAKVYKGRAVIEAAGAGIPVARGDLYIRCNFVTLGGTALILALCKATVRTISRRKKQGRWLSVSTRRCSIRRFKLINTDTFRNILVVEGAADIAEQLAFKPAHDMIGGAVADYTKGDGIIQEYFELMRKAYDVLGRDNDTHANGIWFWGASYAPSFQDTPPEKRVVLAETTLMRGIAALSGADCVTTNEENGFIEFLKEKTNNAIQAVHDYGYAYIHIQKLDDLSHETLPEEKMKAIEQIDRYFIGPFFEAVKAPYSALVVSDHYTFFGQRRARRRARAVYAAEARLGRPNRTFLRNNTAEKRTFV